MSASAADAVRDFIAPLLPGWLVQFGAWEDKGRAAHHCVIKPIGGALVTLIREPQFTVSIIGAENEAASVAGAAADTIIEAMRESAGSLVFMQPGEPAFSAASDGRAIFEFALSTICE